MALFSYTILEQKESFQDPESHIIRSPPTRYHTIVKNALPTVSNAILLVASVLCLAMIAGYVASKVFVWSLMMPDQRDRLPKTFFPSCL